MDGTQLKGTVTRFDGRYYVVECQSAPLSHLKHHNLLPLQMQGADVGDRVTLEYQVTPHSGRWNVVAWERDSLPRRLGIMADVLCHTSVSAVTRQQLDTAVLLLREAEKDIVNNIALIRQRKVADV